MHLAEGAFSAAAAKAKSPERRGSTSAAVSPSRSSPASPTDAVWKKKETTAEDRRNEFWDQRRDSLGWIDRPDGLVNAVDGVTVHRFTEEDEAAGDVDLWTQEKNAHGRVYYRHPVSQATRWDAPEGWMPPGARQERAARALEEEKAKVRAQPWVPPIAVTRKEYSDACCVLA